jgi:PadR family transcriptional regulator, regulatory protein PadR
MKAIKEASRNRKSKSEPESLDLFSGFIKLHILYHASEQAIYGLWLIEELEEHGYRVSPGTLYPLLHSLEESGTLRSYNKLFAGKNRRYYSITPKGRRFLHKAKQQLAELVDEIFEGEDLRSYSRKRKSPNSNGKPRTRTS